MFLHQNQINPSPAVLSYLNFHPLEIVSRYRDPQRPAPHNIGPLQVSGEEKFCFVETSSQSRGSNPRPPTFQALTTAPAPPPLPLRA